jgi:SAM-dependent methyltransferase
MAGRGRALHSHASKRGGEDAAEVQKDDLVYDLGCGDGRIVVTAAKRYGCRAVGFDNNSERVKESRESAKKNGVESLVTIQQRDIFTLDLGKADVVTLYLLPRLNIKLIPQLQKLKPGARIVSHDWDLGTIKPDKVVDVFSEEEHGEHTLYLWTAPLEKE